MLYDTGLYKERYLDNIKRQVRDGDQICKTENLIKISTWRDYWISKDAGK